MSPRGSPRDRFWPIRALVIDDHRPTRDQLRNRLRAMGIIDVWEADDGKTALAILRDFNCGDPDLVICNLQVQQRDALRFCRDVRRDKTLSCRDVPIVFLTLTEDDVLAGAADRVGATKVLSKRAAAGSLAQHLERIVGGGGSA